MRTYPALGGELGSLGLLEPLGGETPSDLPFLLSEDLRSIIRFELFMPR
jgi:hypothetical protein